MTLPVIAIVGPSDSATTRVAEALIQMLTARGYRIAAVKDCPRGHQVDQPATDSARLFAAGAARMVLSSPGQMTSIERTEADMALEEIVASFDSSYDLVVVTDGFRDATVPEVLVLGAEDISPPPHRVIATVSNHGRVGDVPCYSFQELDGLAEQLQDQLLARAPNTPVISLMVDGVPVPLAEFPARVLAGLVCGFLKELKDIPHNPQRLLLVLGAPATPDAREKPSQ